MTPTVPSAPSLLDAPSVRGLGVIGVLQTVEYTLGRVASRADLGSQTPAGRTRCIVTAKRRATTVQSSMHYGSPHYPVATATLSAFLRPRTLPRTSYREERSGNRHRTWSTTGTNRDLGPERLCLRPSITVPPRAFPLTARSIDLLTRLSIQDLRTSA